MTIELIDPAEERAAKHAALSDPSRLRIVDLLTLGDLSPTEIRTILAIPSNLTAHHLNVLESVGMIGRSRSEADKRRSYVHLADTAFDGLIPGRIEQASRVVFVCTANTARSQLAAALWSTFSTIPAASAGTHPAAEIDRRTLAVAARRELPVPDEQPRTLEDVVTESDFIVTVCDNAHEELGVTGHLHWTIPDPVRIGTDDAFEAAYTELQSRIAGLAARLTPAPSR